jgi:hypothetical protein
MPVMNAFFMTMLSFLFYLVAKPDELVKSLKTVFIRRLRKKSAGKEQGYRFKPVP